MIRANAKEILMGIVIGTMMFVGLCIAISGFTYTPKDSLTDKPYFVYQGY